MTRLPVLVAVVLMAVTACGGDGDEAGTRPPSSTVPGGGGGGLSLAVRHPDPLRAGAPVTWTLAVRNDGAGAVTLAFSSGQRGDVVLRQGSVERYRWSQGRAFTQALAEVSLGPGQAQSFELGEDRLGVASGDYDLVASLASQPAPAPATERVTVRS